MSVKFRSGMSQTVNVQNFLLEYQSFVDASATQVLRAQDLPRQFEIDGLVERIQTLNRAADAIKKNVTVWAALAADVKDDVSAVFEETALALGVLDDETEPDKVWARMAKPDKKFVMRDHKVREQTRTLVMSILTLDAKAQRNKIAIPVDPTRPVGYVVDDGAGGPKIVPGGEE